MTPEQRQRALAGLATLLRARVLDPMQAAWTELLREAGDAWQADANAQRRRRQDIQIALEHYAARACVEPPQLAGGSALAEVRACVDALADATNDTLDRLAGMREAAGPSKLAATLDRLVVDLHRWFGELDKLDASLRGAESAPIVRVAPRPVLAPAPSPAPAPAPEPSPEPAMRPPIEAAPTWPPRVEPSPPDRPWWRVASAPASTKAWPSPRHIEPASSSCEDPR